MRIKKNLRRTYFAYCLTALLSSSAFAVENLPETLPLQNAKPSQISDEQQNEEVRKFFNDFFFSLKEEQVKAQSLETNENVATNQNQLPQNPIQFNQVQPQRSEQQVTNIVHFNNNNSFNNEGGVVGKGIEVNKNQQDSDELFPGEDDLGSAINKIKPSKVFRKFDPSFDFSPPALDVSYGDTFKYNKNGLMSLKSVNGGNVNVKKPYNLDDPDVVLLKAPKGAARDLRSSNRHSSAKGKTSTRKNIVLKKKPNKDYRNVKLSDKIYKTDYTKKNKHLPVAVYETDYHNILFNQILKEDLSVIRAMVERIDTTETKDRNGNTPLLFALKNNRFNAAKVLIAMGADIYQTNYNGESIINYIKKSNDKDLMRIVGKYDSAQIKNSKPKKTELTSQVNKADFVKMVNASLSQPKKINTKTTKSSKRFREIPSRYVDSITYRTIFDNLGNTSLHEAAIYNDVTALKQYIEANKNLDIQNESGYTALMLASFYNNKDIVTHLIKAGANINITDEYGRTAKIIAQQNDNLKSYDLLNIASIKTNPDS